MKTIVTLFLTLSSSIVLYAQSFNGQATYESKTSVDFNFGGRDMPPAQKKMIEERMKSAFEKTFVLNFDRTSSTYKEKQKLEQPGGQGGFRFSMMGGGGDDLYYKNIKEQRYSNSTETFGKLFLVQDSLKKLDWKLSGETKKIGNYTCYKATAIRKADPNRMRFGPPPREEKKEEDQKDAAIAKDSTKTESTSLFDRMEAPKDIEVTAWYTMDIPIGQGPAHYWGLPGLILEIQDDRTTLLCSKIVLNPQEAEEIEEPSKGKKVAQAEFDEIIQKKMKEMQERFRAGNRGGEGHRIMIRQD